MLPSVSFISMVIKKVFLSVSIATKSNFLQKCTRWRHNYGTYQPKIGQCENVLWANKLFHFVSKTLAWKFEGIAKHIATLFVIVSKIFTTYEIQKHQSTVHKDGCLNADKMAVKLGTNKNSNGWLPGMVPKGWWLWSKFKNPCRVSTEPF